MLIPLEIPPGIYRNGTGLMAKGRWHDANLVRWSDNSLRPVGGWREFVDTGMSSTVRGMRDWSSAGSNRYVAIGSKDELFAVAANGTIADITPSGLSSGFEFASVNTGYGGGNYGAGTYGTPRQSVATFSPATTWSLDTWGEYLIACSSADGKIYEWALNAGTPAELITSAPISCSGIVVTAERFLFALSAGGNPRKVAWSDRENNTTWTPTATNQAGDIELQSSGSIQQAVRTRGQTLIITDIDAHTATFSGGVAVYSFQRVGDACGAISRLAAVSVGHAAYWMGRRAFYRFTGASVESVHSDVSDHVFTDINRDQISQIWSVSLSAFGEIWWFYPSGGSTTVDSYVAYNYRDEHWSIGKLSRSAGCDEGVWPYPLMVCSDKKLQEHEYGGNHHGADVFAETGPVMLGAGDQVMAVTDLIPDEGTQGEVEATFKTRFHPNDVEREYGPYTMATPTNVRFTGRQVRMRVDGKANTDWRVGVMRLETKAGGGR